MEREINPVQLDLFDDKPWALRARDIIHPEEYFARNRQPNRDPRAGSRAAIVTASYIGGLFLGLGAVSTGVVVGMIKGMEYLVK